MGGQSSCINVVHPLTPNDSRIYAIVQLLKEYEIFVRTIVAYQKAGKSFHLTRDVCHMNSNYKAKCSGLCSSLVEVYGEKMISQYTERFDKQYNILLNCLCALNIEHKLRCDEVILKNKKIRTLLGITE
jgi:hypothetical protein